MLLFLEYFNIISSMISTITNYFIIISVIFNIYFLILQIVFIKNEDNKPIYIFSLVINYINITIFFLILIHLFTSLT